MNNRISRTLVYNGQTLLIPDCGCLLWTDHNFNMFKNMLLWLSFFILQNTLKNFMEVFYV